MTPLFYCLQSKQYIENNPLEWYNIYVDLDINHLLVLYHDDVVGELYITPNNDIAFSYTKEWLSNGFSISPLSLPLINKEFINPKDNFRGLYGVFTDSLPDGWGALVSHTYLESKGVNYEELNPLTQLVLSNESSLGGLRFTPSLNSNSSVLPNSDLDTLSKEMTNLFNSGVSHDIDTIYRYSGHTGGARPKAHIKIDNIDYIVKFPSSLDPKDIGIKEYEANELASLSGINAQKHLLLPSKRCKGYFAATRFDRKDSRRVHVISLSSLLETSHQIPNLDYLYLVSVIKQICININDDLKEAYRRLVFNTLLPNKDDHGKNFSFIYDEEIRGYRLSPMYDITKTTDKLEHEMTVNGISNPTIDDLLNVSQEFNLTKTEAREIINYINNVLKTH